MAEQLPGEVVHGAFADGIATLTLDSPANRNALSAALTTQLAAQLDRAAGDPEIRAVVLTHTGGTFCAGVDLGESRRLGTEQATERMLALIRRVLVHPQPVLAVLDGHARAGGVGILGACDIVVAGPRSTFAFSEVRLGLAPAIITLSTQHLLPPRWAAQYLLTGQTFDAAEAARVGLVTTAAPDPSRAAADVLAELRACSPQGLVETKKLLIQDRLTQFDTLAEERKALSARLFASEEATEGMRAFAEKRAPRWVR